MRFIPSEELTIDTVLSRDIILTTQTAMLKKGAKLTPRYIEFLREKGYLGAYVSDELSHDLELEETIDPRLFQNGVERVMENDIHGTMDIAQGIVEDIVNKRNICTDLLDLRSFDDYTYHHSVNVAVYATIVGRHLGMKQDELNLICQAGLLHDIGKSRIGDEIINKPGALTDEEFATVKQHAQFSYEMLAEDKDVAAVVKQAVLYHHENQNGSGYPHGKTGPEVSDMARIIHVVDVYDALTSKRPYKDPYEPSRAFEYLVGGKGIQFDPDIVESLIEVVPAYPVGVDIYLSNGERALVMESSGDHRLRPKVRMVEDAREVDLLNDPAYKSVRISGSGILPKGNEQGAIGELNEGRSAVRALKKHVVVVDDTPMALMQAKAILEDDYILSMYSSGLDFLTFQKENPDKAPDLIVMDIEMPFMDGVSCIKKSRERGWDNVPVIFLTSVNQTDIIVTCKKLGKSDYILKPAKPVYLKERVYESVYKRRGQT